MGIFAGGGRGPDYAPKRSVYRTYFNQPDLDQKLETIEEVKGIIGAFVVDVKHKHEPQLEILVDHPLTEEEKHVFEKAFPNGEYSIAHQVLMPIRLVPPPGRMG